MTRVLFDLQQQTDTDYVYTNVAGITVENHTAKPDIIIESLLERSSPTNNSNGKIVFIKAEPANSLEQGPSRHKVWFIDGYIEHQNTVIFDDATVNAMKAEMERGYNVYNATISTYTYKFISSGGWNTDRVNPIYFFTVEVVQYGVSAYT